MDGPQQQNEVRVEDFNKGYNRICERETRRIKRRKLSTQDNGFETSVSGISKWTVTEKANLFRSLERCSSSNLKDIAEAVNTKSIPEVQAFLQGLSGHQGHLDEVSDEFEADDPPAVVELDHECEQTVDRAAAALREWQLYQDADAEGKKYGDHWLFDWALVNSANQSDSQLPQEVREACDLLNLKELLVLSFKWFMSSTDPDMDWATYSPDGPSTFCSVLIDLHRLVVDFTKRLIVSAMFIARSRLRATKSYSQRHDNLRAQDVRSAVDILGLARDPHDYWSKLPRRGGLKVLLGEPRFGEKETFIEYDEVEGRLEGSATREAIPSIEAPSSGVGQAPTPQESVDRDKIVDDEGEDSDDSETRELDIRDQGTNVKGMRELYRVLEKEPPNHLRDNPEPLPPPRKRRRVIESPGDWKKLVDFQAEWEIMDRLDEGMDASDFAVANESADFGSSRPSTPLSRRSLSSGTSR